MGGTAIIVDPSKPMTICPKKDCNYTFCCQCKDEHENFVEWHENSNCTDYMRWRKENGKGDGSLAQWAKDHDTKNCPMCGKLIEKNGGCQHMGYGDNVCCGYEWCWICEHPYISGQTDKKGREYLGCTSYSCKYVQFAAGQKVTAKWTNGRWYSATIVALNARGSKHRVSWDDGKAVDSYLLPTKANIRERAAAVAAPVRYAYRYHGGYNSDNSIGSY